jgi:hypothetical protein
MRVEIALVALSILMVVGASASSADRKPVKVDGLQCE